MPISYPTSLDSLTNPAPSDRMDVVDHAAQHANANDAVEALEAKVGVNSSTVTTSLDYKASKRHTSAGVTISALDVNWSGGANFTKTISANSTFTFSNDIDGQTVVVAITNSGSYTVTWPAVTWEGGSAPTQSASATDVYVFRRIGSTIFGNVFSATASSGGGSLDEGAVVFLSQVFS